MRLLAVLCRTAPFSHRTALSSGAVDHSWPQAEALEPEDWGRTGAQGPGTSDVAIRACLDQRFSNKTLQFLILG